MVVPSPAGTSVSPEPRNDFADADASAQRKRPRLEHSGRVHRSMSADPSATPTGPSGSDHDTASSSLTTPPPALHGSADDASAAKDAQDGGDSDDASAVMPDAGSGSPPLATPSKVTINVRDFAHASSPSYPSARPSHSTGISVDGTATTGHQPTAAHIASAQIDPRDEPTEPDTASSATGSPEIEAAEPEDIASPIPASVWVHTPGGDEAARLNTAVMETLPFLEPEDCPESYLERLNWLVDHKPGDAAQRLVAFSRWLTDYLALTHDLKSRWFDSCSLNMEFWLQVPHLYHKTLFYNMSPSQPATKIQAPAYPHAAEDVVLAFAAITARMLQIDLQTLESYRRNPGFLRDLLSWNYTRVLGEILGRNAIQPLFSTLHHQNYDTNAVLDEILQRFITKLPQGLNTLLTIAQLSLERGSSGCEQVVATITALFKRCVAHATGTPADHASNQYRLLSTGADPKLFFHTLLHSLHQYTMSKRTFPLDEGLKICFSELSDLLKVAMLGGAASFNELIPGGYETQFSDLGLEDQINFVNAAWKMPTFLKLITQGRMKARICGVDCMGQLLSETHRSYIQPRSSTQPSAVVDFLVKFLRHHSLLDYLFGVQSHPQVINRSWCIIGFLMVSQAYNYSDTDALWDALIKCQDHMTIEAITFSLSQLVGLAGLDHTLYFLGKFSTIPPASFNAPMRHLCDHNVSHATELAASQLETEQDRMLPFMLFLRLLQASFSERTLSQHQRQESHENQELYHFAARQLSKLFAKFPVSEADRTRFLNSCMPDISEGSYRASGSTTALGILLSDAEARAQICELEALQEKWDLVDVLLEDLSRLAKTVSDTPIVVEEFEQALRDHLSCICIFIRNQPSIFTPKLTAQTWSMLVGTKSPDRVWREISWYHLTQATGLCAAGRNQFLDNVLASQFSKLESRQLTHGVLSFADAVSKYHDRVKGLTSPAGALAPKFSVQDMYWTISLKTSDNAIAEKASSKLVCRELDLRTGNAGRTDSSDRDAEFIKRGMDALMCLAEKLKAMQEQPNRTSQNQEIRTSSGNEASLARIKFSRVINILMKFLRLAPVSSSPGEWTQVEIPGFPGEKTMVRIAHHRPDELLQMELKLGDKTSLKDLETILCVQTDISKVRLVTDGRLIQTVARADTSILENPALLNGIIQVTMAPGSLRRQLRRPARILVLAPKVLKHFPDLYELLSGHRSLGSCVYRFLTSFDPHEEIVSQLLDPSLSVSEAFPRTERLKSMYSAYALRHALGRQVELGDPSAAFIHQGIRLLVAAILSLDSAPLDPSLALHLIDSLLAFMREQRVLSTSAQDFEGIKSLVRQLGRLTAEALVLDEDEKRVMLINAAFATIIETLQHNERLVSDFDSSQMVSGLLRLLLLGTSQQMIRASATETIRDAIAGAVSGDEHGALKLYSFFWSLLKDLIPSAASFESSEEFFTLANKIFGTLPPLCMEKLPLPSYIEQWSLALLEYERPRQFENEIDWNIQGLGALICTCGQALDNVGSPAWRHRDFARALWNKYLFPDPQPATASLHVGEKPPLFDLNSRGRLYALILMMASDSLTLKTSIELCSALHLHQEKSSAWAWGYVQIGDDFAEEKDNWAIDPYFLRRPFVGYPGLQNLSNTCYLNSLLSQLFMNVRFRSFMLSLRLEDSQTSQKLLWETQRLFGYQQRSLQRAIDTINFANEIVTYEGTAIDVSLQMDVDEFYNLLFERWESQIQDQNVRSKFQKLYGGQIVQQIKSRDCEHISESFEPFSAVQCEIQGMRTLKNSLDAYVKGEVMEGANKYSCTSCGTYVNAIKRACFKEVPDDLILHLKRFDYDLTAGTRNKINDYFEFPDELDMGQFNVEHLKEPSRTDVADWFTLVGVLVHSGQAEAGHYYSYIRDTSREPEMWFEFNDADVEQFDSREIGRRCYGGLQDPSQGPASYKKPFNAYMLFYRRTSSITASGTQLTNHIPASLTRQITASNSSFLRNYFMLADEHGSFMEGLFRRYKEHYSGTNCSEDHSLESTLMRTSLAHLYEIFARQQTSQSADAVIALFQDMSTQCSNCGKMILELLNSSEHIVKDLLLRCQHDQTREGLATLINLVLIQARDHHSVFYGLYTPTSSQESLQSPNTFRTGAFSRMVRNLEDVVANLGTSKYGWPQTFGLLRSIALLGELEHGALRSTRIFDWSINYLATAAIKPPPGEEWQEFYRFHQLYNKHRFPLAPLVVFISIMLQYTRIERGEETDGSDFSPSSACSSVLTYENGIALSLDLKHRSYNWPKSGSPRPLRPLAILLSVLQVTRDDTKICEDFVKALYSMEHLRSAMVDTFIFALEKYEGPSLGPVLMGAAAYLEMCPDKPHLRQIMEAASREACSVHRDSSSGPTYLGFFVRIWRFELPDDIPGLGLGFGPRIFRRELLRWAPRFAPFLLTCEDEAVRKGALNLLQELVIDGQDSSGDEEYAEQIERMAAGVCRCCMVWIQHQVKDQAVYTKPRVEQIQQTLLAYMGLFKPEDESDAASASQAVAFTEALEGLEIITASSPELMSTGNDELWDGSDDSNAS